MGDDRLSPNPPVLLGSLDRGACALPPTGGHDENGCSCCLAMLHLHRKSKTVGPWEDGLTVEQRIFQQLHDNLPLPKDSTWQRHKHCLKIVQKSNVPER